MRFDVLDGIRGHLLFMMMITHMSAVPGMSYLLNIHHAVIFSLWDAEFLVLLSGLLAGILYVDKFKGPQKQARFLRSRLVKIYRFYLYSTGPFLILLALSPGVGLPDMVGGMLEVLLIQNGGGFSDILPIYIYCFALLWLATVTIVRFGTIWVLVPSALIYLLSQPNYAPGFFGLGQKFMMFDIAAWQFLFAIFYVVGSKYHEICRWLRSLPDRQFLGLLATAGVLALSQRWLWVYPPFGTLPDEAHALWFRMQLHPVHLLRTLLVTAFFGLLLAHSTPVTRWAQRVVQWYFTLKLLRLCGVWAIQMFVIHVYLIAFFFYFHEGWGATMKLSVAVVLQLVFMVLPLGVDWWMKRPNHARSKTKGDVHPKAT